MVNVKQEDVIVLDDDDIAIVSSVICDDTLRIYKSDDEFEGTGLTIEVYHARILDLNNRALEIVDGKHLSPIYYDGVCYLKTKTGKKTLHITDNNGKFCWETVEINNENPAQYGMN